jgi:hypothetical protein
MKIMSIFCLKIASIWSQNLDLEFNTGTDPNPDRQKIPDLMGFVFGSGTTILPSNS